MMDFKPLVTLLAIVNPLACVAFFIRYTQHFTHAQRRCTIVISAFSAFSLAGPIARALDKRRAST